MRVKKCFLVITTVVLFSLISISTHVKAAVNYKIWNTSDKEIVEPTKVWNIKFTKGTTIQSSKKSIAVYKEENNEKVDLEFTSSDGGKIINISPSKPYESGKSYTLVVEDSLEAEDGEKIKQPIKFSFKIQPVQSTNEQGTISSYSEYYDAVKNTLSNYESSITLFIENYDKSMYNLEVIDEILLKNPNLRGVYEGASATILYSDPAKLVIKFSYADSRENLINKERVVEEKVTEIVNNLIKPEMKDYEKELVLHDYLVNNATYDKRLYSGNMPEDSYTAYGVLINSTGVCQGYAEAMNRLLLASGIESLMIVGDAYDGDKWIGHAWNMVKLDGEYYHVDSTWDDPVTSDGSNKLVHSYFNITDEQMSKDHRWNREDYPEANGTIYNFNNLNIEEKDSKGNTIIVVNNYDEFYNAIKGELEKGNNSISLKVLDYNETTYDLRGTLQKISNKTATYGTFSISMSTDEINNAEYIRITVN
ncbi:hypothetical protein N4T77_03135 [Clostridium sp. CX1]|uniref:transglutaminase domain-containing protein n=1 Tax=Clostridium sp. CX1 TaxID=2978346 RepID=UPI0021C05590|nr:transglutaminase domain-containing protein [Clostridium sp. CX1]MCT8975587.1 hypothetical protein [Clostridium sp. CX1]